MDLITVKQLATKLSKKNKAVEHTIYLNEKEGEFYIGFPNKEGFPMFIEEETNEPVEIGTKKLARFKREAVYVNGVELVQTKEVPPAKEKKRLSEEIMEEADEIEQKEKQAKSKKPAAAVNADTVKKSNKKAAKTNGKAKFPTKVGEKKELTVKAITALLEKGQVGIYRQSLPDARGVITLKRAKAIKGQDAKIAVIVVKR
jgi:hypothetical protein